MHGMHVLTWHADKETQGFKHGTSEGSQLSRPPLQQNCHTGVPMAYIMCTKIAVCVNGWSKASRFKPFDKCLVLKKRLRSAGTIRRGDHPDFPCHLPCTTRDTCKGFHPSPEDPIFDVTSQLCLCFPCTRCCLSSGGGSISSTGLGCHSDDP